MSRLALFLLGSPRIERDGAPVRVGRRKSVALIAYLAMTGESHSRDTLATLLWPEHDQSRARAGLRAALSTLKKAVGGGWLDVDRESVGLNPNVAPWASAPGSASEQELWVDVAEFRGKLAEGRTHGHPEEEVCADCLPALAEAAELYHDDFLAGFTLRDSPAFDEWQFFQTEGLRNELLGALARLARAHGARGEFEQGIAHARRWAALDPLHEPAHCQLMHLYAWSGQRAAALHQYETCRRVLEAELGAEPSEGTRSLYEQIRTDVREVSTPVPDRLPAVPLQLPAFLEGEKEQAVSPRSLFVARERELAQLDAHLAAALEGQGRIVFVTGEAGSGKTALMAEFARRAQEAHAEVIVASGTCNAYSGVGDPYLPFRDVMGMLAGDVEARWAAGLISREHARRLWGMLPESIQALVDRAPDLIDVFVAGKELLSRAMMAAPGGADWLEALRELTARGQAGAADLNQSHLMGQYANVLHSLAAGRPLLITLDDLQWADVASIGLLFHLARNLAGSRILLVGAYRAEEVALGRDGARSEDHGRHPLQKVLNEFKRTFGDIWLDLSAVGENEGRAFVDAFLDTEPNRLGEGFRQALLRQTGGHPLFTIELLRGMQERGSLVWHEDRRWVESSTLDWRTLPARVEGVVEERVGGLEPALREILSVASVEGERFTAEVVARVRGLGEREVLRSLAQLERRHHLVREREGTRVDGQFLSRYQFSHILFQRYLYDQLSAAERRLLHGEIAGILEDLYRGRTDEITVQLAGHYTAAGEREKAVEYLLQAGDQARRLYAYQEAIGYYQRALAFLKEQGEHERAARTLMKLGLTYHLALDFPRARQAYEEGFPLWQRAGEMQEGAPPPPAPHALRVSLGHPTILDPTMTMETISITVIEQLFSGLAERTPAMGVVPDMAQSWEVSEGGRKYLFHLREDARWSDGTPLTAGDFEYTWKRSLDPVTKSPVAGTLDDVRGAKVYHQGHTSDPDRVGVRALDDVTLVVELEGPTAYLPHLLTLSGSYPLPQHVVEAHGDAWTEVENIVTSGPFRLEAWQRGQSAVLVRNPAYHGRFTGNVQRLEVSLLADPFARLELYEADGLDIYHLCDLPPAELDRARHRHAGDYISVPALGTLYVGFDASRPPFDDPRVRRAFVLATDRGTLVDGVLRGTVFPATGGFVPQGMLGHSAGIALPYDPDGARQLLAEAGYPRGRGFPTVNLLTDHRRSPHSEYLQAHWRENLGVEITVETMDWPAFYDRLDREPPHMFCIGYRARYPDPNDILGDASSRGWRRTLWQNERYDGLVEEAKRASDQGRRMEMYQEADRILVEEAPIMPLTYYRCHLLVKPWVRRWPISATTFWFWKDIIIDPH
jgi:ABC-type oligopeptide transport system substrate-binding subunit/DNA-binding SARP family transcriptional activator